MDGLIGDVAWQVVKEGHHVKYSIERAQAKDIADGFVPKIEDWKDAVDWADVIVFDDVLGQGKKAEQLRKKQIVHCRTGFQFADDRVFHEDVQA